MSSAYKIIWPPFTDDSNLLRSSRYTGNKKGDDTDPCMPYTKIKLAHSKTKPINKQNTKRKKTQWSRLIIFGSIDYKTIAKSRGAGSVDNYFHLTHY